MLRFDIPARPQMLVEPINLADQNFPSQRARPKGRDWMLATIDVTNGCRGISEHRLNLPFPARI